MKLLDELLQLGGLRLGVSELLPVLLQLVLRLLQLERSRPGGILGGCQRARMRIVGDHADQQAAHGRTHLLLLQQLSQLQLPMVEALQLLMELLLLPLRLLQLQQRLVLLLSRLQQLQQRRGRRVGWLELCAVIDARPEAHADHSRPCA